MDFDEWWETWSTTEFDIDYGDPYIAAYKTIQEAWEVATKEEREACKQACRVVIASYPLTGHAAVDCLTAIGRRSNASGKPTTEAAKPL